jgi:hypothetical protein
LRSEAGGGTLRLLKTRIILNSYKQFSPVAEPEKLQIPSVLNPCKDLSLKSSRLIAKAESQSNDIAFLNGIHRFTDDSKDCFSVGRVCIRNGDIPKLVGREAKMFS